MSFACCCFTIKYLTLGTFFEIFFSYSPYINAAGTVEYRCLVSRSEQLSVLFQRRKYKAEAVYLLKRKKGFLTYLYHPLGQGYVPPARISIYQKIEVYIPLSIIRWDRDMFRQPKYLSWDQRYIPLSIIRWGKDMFRQPESISIIRARSTHVPVSVYQSSKFNAIKSALNCWTKSSNNAARAVEASAKHCQESKESSTIACSMKDGFDEEVRLEQK